MLQRIFELTSPRNPPKSPENPPKIQVWKTKLRVNQGVNPQRGMVTQIPRALLSRGFMSPPRRSWVGNLKPLKTLQISYGCKKKVFGKK
jgi:hypothetical protein